jgi:hypothetical protein
VASSRREDFVRQVFWNVHDVLAVNNILAERLTKRQKQQPVVEAIGDLFLDRVPLFEPFVTYGAHQLFGKYEFEKEKGSNPAFQKFVEASDILLVTVLPVKSDRDIGDRAKARITTTRAEWLPHKADDSSRTIPLAARGRTQVHTRRPP